MKKRIQTVFLLMSILVFGFAGCQAAEQAIKPEYKTVTEAMDWGPAITKVILDMGVTVDEATIGTETFLVSSERRFSGNCLQKERNVLACYVSDAEGKPDAEGTYITLEMEVAPDKEEGSPFYYNPKNGLNQYVKTAYLIQAAEDAAIKTKDGVRLIMEATDASGSQGNLNVLADAFDCTGKWKDEKGRIFLRYASYMPEQAEEGKTPLLIWLHGAGEGGTDPTIALLGNKVVNLAAEDIQQYFGETGAGILVPQTPTIWMDGGNGWYMDTEDATAGTSCYTEALMNLIETYVSEHKEIDKSRIYLGGCSNGGYMTVNMLIEYPGYFAAAFPICEAYAANWLSDEKIAILKDVPIWLTAAKTDAVVSVKEYSSALYGRLAEAGAQDIHYSLFPKVADTSGKYFKKNGKTPYEYQGHWSWIYALNNECAEEIGGREVTMFEWLSWHAREER